MDKKIKNIIFDLGGVLVGFDGQRSISSFEALGCHDVAQYVVEHRTEDLFADIELGRITTAEFCNEVRRISGTNAKDADIIEAWNALLTPMSAVKRQRLMELHQQGYRLFLLSNTNDMHWQLCGYVFDIAPLFEHCFLSYEMHLIKPNEEIYREVLRQADIRAEETIFIDDNLDNIKAARRVGLHVFHNETPDAWLAEIKAPSEGREVKGS